MWVPRRGATRWWHAAEQDKKGPPPGGGGLLLSHNSDLLENRVFRVVDVDIRELVGFHKLWIENERAIAARHDDLNCMAVALLSGPAGFDDYATLISVCHRKVGLACASPVGC